MTPSNKKPTHSISNRSAKLFVTAACFGLLFCASALSRADVRVTPAAGCTTPLGYNVQEFYVAGGAWSRVTYFNGSPTDFQCPLATGLSFLPARIYVDFKLESTTTVYASVYRQSYDGSTAESRTLVSGTYGAGAHDVGTSVTFLNYTTWDYFSVSVQGVASGDFFGVGYSN
jgi:hypothetical protein